MPGSTAGLIAVLAHPVQEVQSLLGGTAADGGDRGGGRLPLARTAAGAPRPAAGGSRGGAQQFKASFVRKWMVVDREGHASVFQPHKLEITQQMGVQLRDLRLLDPLLATSYPSAILCRPAALVVNLENLKMIVTTERAFITNLEDENVVTFVEELCRRLAAAAAAAASLAAADAEGVPGTGPAPPPGVELPFELRVLEVALDTVCTRLEALTGELEAAAHPALDSLTLKVSKDNLERVRRIKSRMVRLTTRVETLREVLVRLMDDEGDMRDMNLSAKIEIELHRRLTTLESGGVTPVDAAAPPDASWRTSTGLATVHEGVELAAASGAEAGGSKADDELGAMAGGAYVPGPLDSLAPSYDSEDEEREAIDVVEDMLEAYFMSIDNTWNKLQTLCEYIEDTEDFINIELDSKRNHLIRVDLILTALNASVSLIIAVTALFAMNFRMQPGDDWPGQGPYSWFVAVTVCCGLGAIGTFATVVFYAKRKRLL